MYRRVDERPIWVKLGLAVVLFLIFQQPISMAAQQATPSVGRRVPYIAPPAQDISPLSPVLLLQSSHFVAGQPVMVRLGFRNPSAHTIDIRSGQAPWDESTLTIVGPDGQVVAAGVGDFGPDDGSGRIYSIRPGATQFIGTAYYPLDHWGYHLTQPGRYTISVRGLAAGPGSINVERQQRTTVTVTIDPRI